MLIVFTGACRSVCCGGKHPRPRESGPDAVPRVRALHHLSPVWLAVGQLVLLPCCIHREPPHPEDAVLNRSPHLPRVAFHWIKRQHPSPACARFRSVCTGGSFGRWPKARQTRRARRSSLRANTSSLMECGCRPSAGGRWRRSPISPSEVATYGSSRTQSQVNTPVFLPPHGAFCLHAYSRATCSALQRRLRVSPVIIKVWQYKQNSLHQSWRPLCITCSSLPSCKVANQLVLWCLTALSWSQSSLGPCDAPAAGLHLIGPSHASKAAPQPARHKPTNRFRPSKSIRDWL